MIRSIRLICGNTFNLPLIKRILQIYTENKLLIQLKSKENLKHYEPCEFFVTFAVK